MRALRKGPRKCTGATDKGAISSELCIPGGLHRRGGVWTGPARMGRNYRTFRPPEAKTLSLSVKKKDGVIEKALAWVLIPAQH